MERIVQYNRGLVEEIELKFSPLDTQSSTLVAQRNVYYQLPDS